MVPDVQQPLSQISDTASPLLILPPPVPSPSPALRPLETPVVGAPGMGSVPTEPDDEEGLKHLEQVKMTRLFFLLSDHHKVWKTLNVIHSVSCIRKDVLCIHYLFVRGIVS